MLTLSYLQGILDNEVPGLKDTAEQVLESAAGYDGIIEIIETKGLPIAVILEHNELGNLSVRPGGFQTSSQSIWVMQMVAADEDRRAIQLECWSMAKRIISVLLLHLDIGEPNDKPIAQWDPHDIPYGIRNAGPNYTGYELVLHFAEDIDLSYHPLPQPDPTPTVQPTEEETQTES